MRNSCHVNNKSGLRKVTISSLFGQLGQQFLTVCGFLCYSYKNGKGGCFCLQGTMLKNLHEYASKFWTDRSKAIMVCILLSFYSFFYHKFPVIKTTLVILVNITIRLPGSHLADLTAFEIYGKSGLLLLLLLLLLLFVGIF